MSKRRASPQTPRTSSSPALKRKVKNTGRKNNPDSFTPPDTTTSGDSFDEKEADELSSSDTTDFDLGGSSSKGTVYVKDDSFDDNNDDDMLSEGASSNFDLIEDRRCKTGFRVPESPERSQFLADTYLMPYIKANEGKGGHMSFMAWVNVVCRITKITTPELYQELVKLGRRYSCRQSQRRHALKKKTERAARSLALLGQPVMNRQPTVNAQAAVSSYPATAAVETPGGGGYTSGRHNDVVYVKEADPWNPNFSDL